MRAIPPDPASTTGSRGVPPRRVAAPSCGLRLRNGLLAGRLALGHGGLVDRHDLDLSNDLSDVHAHLRVCVLRVSTERGFPRSCLSKRPHARGATWVRARSIRTRTERRFGMRDRTTRTMDVAAVPAAGSPSPQRIRWGAVFAGVVLGTALLALISTLWFALAFNSGIDTIRINLEWYVGGTAIVALFIGGLLAGWLSGVRGAGSGLFNGFTVWGLILLVALVIGIPAVFNVFNLGRVTAITDGTTITSSGVDTALWASFWTILGGFLDRKR